MTKTTTLFVFALAFGLSVGAAPAGTPAIGAIQANGSFRVDQETIRGNATLLEGSLVETAAAPASLDLNSGARLSLAPESRARLFGDRLVLERGGTGLEESSGIRLVALGLTIQPGSATTASVVLDSPRRVRVAAGNGSLRVLNSSGQLIANLAAGSALSFEPQDGPSNVVRVTGILENKSGRYFLTDEVTKVRVEVSGDGVAQQSGHRVEVTGVNDPAATPASGATQLVRAREVRRLEEKDRPAAVAAGTGGGTAGGGKTVTTVAVVGGVAAAATVGGLAARDNGPRETTPNSR